MFSTNNFRYSFSILERATTNGRIILRCDASAAHNLLPLFISRTRLHAYKRWGGGSPVLPAARVFSFANTYEQQACCFFLLLLLAHKKATHYVPFVRYY